MSNPYCSLVDLFDRFDRRAIKELSNDVGVPDGDVPKIYRILDAQASRLESALYGMWALPIVINGGSSAAPINAGDTTFTTPSIPAGITTGARLAIGPDTTNPAEVISVTSISGNVLTIVGDGAAGGFLFPHGSGAPFGMVPGVLSDYVATMAADRLWGRRATRPEGLDKDVEFQNKWLDDLLNGRVSIPGVFRSTTPILQSSDATNGTSQFDYLFGFTPSATGPSRGL